jgi:hypothetical protein
MSAFDPFLPLAQWPTFCYVTVTAGGISMHLHLPKPRHGWREFAGEVGIIVIGVLIALGAEQLVQWVHGREDVAQLRAALKGELADDRARWEYMSAADRCTLRRLDALNNWVATAPSGARVADAYPILSLNLHSSSWDIAKTSAATAQIPLDERLTYASLYAALENWREVLRNEVLNTQMIAALSDTANQPENRRQIPALLSRARNLMRFREATSPYLIKRFDALGIRPDVSTLIGAADPHELCKPLNE